MATLSVTALRGRQKVFFEGSFETEELALLTLTEEHRFTLSRAYNRERFFGQSEALRALSQGLTDEQIDRLAAGEPPEKVLAA